MSENKILQSAITGTSLMTAYSYLISIIKVDQFREPELLNQWLHYHLPASVRSNVFGWTIHYGVGLSFVAIYKQLWKSKKMDGLVGTLLLGLTSGALAVGVWRMVLKIHPSPPANVKAFRRHLLLAHVVFVLGSKVSS
jgi:hypothetical protein